MIILGSGNMATNLAHAFHREGVSISCIYSHSAENARMLAEQIGCPWTDSLEDVNRYVAGEQLQPDGVGKNVLIYALKDSVLHDVLLQINAPHALHLHTAGSMGIEVFEGTDKPHAGVLYPFQTLSKNRILDFHKIPVFIETVSTSDHEVTNGLARAISNEVFYADSATRRKLHLAGVFANNFTNCMYAIGGEILQSAGLPEHVLLSLIDETAAKVHSLPARMAQTGPAKRYDENVMQAHLEMLEDPNLKEIYKAVSKNIHAHN